MSKTAKKKTEGTGGGGSRWFNVVEVALWVMVAGAVAFRLMPTPKAVAVAEKGSAPDFTVRTLNAGKVSLSDLRGRVVLVNFWATWCPPCRLEIPGFERVYQEYEGKGFTVVGLSTDEAGPGVVSSFIQQNGVTYPIGMATEEMRRLYGGVDALPESFLLDRTGHVRKMVEGIFSEATLRRELDQLLAEPAQ
jgi:peroxiredoxin